MDVKEPTQNEPQGSSAHDAQRDDAGASGDNTAVEELRQQIEELRKQNEQLFARLRKAQTEPKPVARQPRDEGGEEDEEAKPDLNSLLEEKLSSQTAAVEELVELRMQGYSRDEIQYIVNYAAAQGKTPMEVVEDPFVVGGIERMRAVKKAKEVATSTDKPVGNRQKSFREMTREERKQFWETQGAKAAEELF